MSDIYTKNVMDHFMNPRNVGEIKDADAIGEVGNAKCGDIMRMYLKIDDNVITDIKFKTFGCGAAIATSSKVTEMVKGMTIEDALKVTNKDVIEALGGLPEIKIHCSVLAEEAIRDAINNYRKKHDLPGADNDPVCTGCCEGCGTTHGDHDG
jgi:nitrogen fixation protein NifU and related proteins